MRLTILIVLLALVWGGIPACESADEPPVWGWLIIPSIALYEPIGVAPLVDGQYDLTELGGGVAWLEGTSTLETTHSDLIRPGYFSPLVPPDPAYLAQETGRIVLAGHSTGAFARLDEVRIGDEIVVIDWQRAETFRVVSITLVDPGDTSWLAASEGESLALITCAGADLEWRRVVVAERIGS